MHSYGHTFICTVDVALLVLFPEWEDCTTSLITSNKKEIRWADLY